MSIGIPEFATQLADLQAQFVAGDIDQAELAAGLRALWEESENIPLLFQNMQQVIDVKAAILTAWQAALNVKGQVASVSALPAVAADRDAYQLVNPADPLDRHLFTRVSGVWTDIGPLGGERGASAFDVAVAVAEQAEEEPPADEAAFIQSLRQPALDAADVAQSAADNADAKAELANTKAGVAQTAADNADAKAALANTKAGLADAKAALANDKATVAQAAADAANLARDVAMFKAFHDTLAHLNADLAPTAGQLGAVYADATLDNNGTYVRNESNSPPWTKLISASALGLQPLAPESGYAFAIVDNQGRAALLIGLDGTVTLTKVAAKSLAGSALVDGSVGALAVAPGSLTKDRLSADVQSVLALNLDPLSGYMFAIMDTANRAAFLVRNTGEVEIPTLVLPTDFIDQAALKPAVRSLLPSAMSSAETGYMFAIMDQANRSVFLVKNTGEVEIPTLALPGNFIDQANLKPDMRALFPSAMSASETGYVFAIMDGQSRSAFSVTQAGAVEIPGLVLGANVVDLANLKPAVRALMPTAMSSESGYVFAIVDSQDRMAFGIATDGTVYGSFLPKNGSITTPLIADEAVTPAKLPAALQRQSVAKVTDVVAVYPDDWRSKQGRCAARTELSGYGWSPFPTVLTKALQGVNDTGSALQFRRRSQLLLRGRRYISAFDPAAAGPDSKLFKNNFVLTTSWPPSGSFVAGDYYEYGDSASRTIGSDTYTRGDLAVYTGSAWARQAKPPGITGGQGDWYNATSAGWWKGLQLAAGDFLFCHGVKSLGGPAYYEWGKGAPDQGEFFLKGQWDPASGLPSSPVNGEVYQVSAAGTVAGVTYAVDDYLLRDDGVWGRIPTDAISAFAAGDYVFLTCRRDSGEFEFRRSDKSATRVGLSLKCQTQSVPRRNDDGVVMYGDSMVNLLAPALATEFGTRLFTAFSYGGGSFTDVLSMISRDIRELGDPYRGRAHIVYAGQNGFGDFVQNEEQALRLINMIGARDMRMLFMMVLGQRIPTFNGTRLVFDHFENQFNNVSSSSHVKLREFYKRNIPEQWFDTRVALASTAGATSDLQFPGMTEAQVAATYGIPPLSAWLDYATVAAPNVIVPASLIFQGYRSADGLPTGGADNDYYLRSAGVPANGESSANGVGNIIVRVAGTWTELTFDKTHFFSPTVKAAAAAAVKGTFISKGW